MSLRRLEIVGLAAALAAGAALTPGTISADAGRILVIFLGLVAASILPTITLLINSMTLNGRSVQDISRLEAEIQASMDALFLLFGSVGIAVCALISLEIEPAQIMRKVPYLTTDVLPRFGQALVVCASTLIIWKIGQIPAILRKTLKVRYEATIEEAKSKLSSKSSEPGKIRQAFATHPEFGKVVSLQDIKNQEQ